MSYNAIMLSGMSANLFRKKNSQANTVVTSTVQGANRVSESQEPATAVSPLYKFNSINVDKEQMILTSGHEETIDVIESLSVSLGSFHAGFKDKMSRAVTNDFDKTVNNTPRSASPERLSDISSIKTAQMMADSKNYFTTPMTRTASETSSVGTLQAGGSEDEFCPHEIIRSQSDYKAFANAPASLDLPMDRPRSTEYSFAGAESQVHIETPLKQLLTSLGHDHGSDLATLVLVGWSIVLSRLSGQDDIVIGMGDVDEKRLSFDALPIRFDLSGEPNTYQLLERVRDALVVSDAHRPSLKDAGDITTPKHKTDLPLFQVAFFLYNGDIAQEQADYVSVQCDLELHLLQDKEDATVSIRYATALFNKDTIERHLGYLNAALMNMAANASHPVGTFDIISSAEKKIVLETWNDSAAQFPADRCVHQLFVENAEKSPEAIAIVHNDEALTYVELNALADRIAHQLVEADVKHGDFVAILLQRSIELVAAQLAVLKVGAAYVPIDSKAPVERQAFIVRDSSAVLLVTDADTEIPSALALPLLRLDALIFSTTDTTTLRSTEMNVTNIDRAGSSMDTAYVMYTSGSTGLPKGVMVSHLGIARLVINSGYTDIGPDDRVAFAANPAFDASTFEVWTPLLNGGQLVVIDSDIFTDSHLLALALEQYQVNTLWLTMALFNQYVYTIGPALAKLKYLLCGGEQGNLETFRALLKHGGPEHLINGYGPTETTTFATTYEASTSDEHLDRLPIGRPIGNTRVYVLDKYGKPAPQGAVGELYIGGAGVANGYLNRPDLTAERFLPDPFDPTSSSRMYRSGDLVRYLPDGNLVFMGRNDDQVKIRGFRIELGEIEARLVEHELVKEAAVLAVGDKGEKRLVAYVVADSVRGLALALRSHIEERLPEYMIPSAFVRLDALPKTSNGKVDRRALPEPQEDDFVRQVYEAPIGETELAIATIWSELLGVGQISRHDSFFALGGHSLLIVKMLDRLHALGLTVSTRTLFESPTLM
ncbi:hypothetical protein BGX28_010381, partial [Mortierella sp. GBA30]